MHSLPFYFIWFTYSDLEPTAFLFISYISYPFIFRLDLSFRSHPLPLHITVSGRLRKQEIVALSTAKAEYVTLTHALKEAIWLRHLIGELTRTIKEPTVLFCDYISGQPDYLTALSYVWHGGRYSYHTTSSQQIHQPFAHLRSTRSPIELTQNCITM